MLAKLNFKLARLPFHQQLIMNEACAQQVSSPDVRSLIWTCVHGLRAHDAHELRAYDVP